MRPGSGSFLTFLPLFGVLGCSDGDIATPAAPDLNGYCGSTTPELLAAAGDPVTPLEPLSEVAIEGSACNAVERSYMSEGGTHVAPCTPVEFGSNPPASGTHYGYFPEFRVFEHAIPRGFVVHGLEHGGVAIGYSCKSCAAEVAAATELVSTLEVSPLCCNAEGCPSSATNQLLLTPDPGLGTAWAAASWGFTLTADCFEPDVFRAFAEAHRSQAPEQICSNTGAIDVTVAAP
jgi:hypothetical protein